MKFIKISSKPCESSKPCGKDYGKPKGKLDTQLFPECKGTPYDRDVVKKNTKPKTKDESKQIKPTCKCGPKCKCGDNCQCGPKTKDNPWAICTDSVGRENKDKYERCVLDVKKQNKDK